MLVLAIGNISFAVLMSGYARACQHPALRLWMLAKLVQGLAHGLGWLRPELHSIWASVLANTLLVGGIAMEVGAYANFFGLQRWRRVLVPMTLLSLLVLHSARFGDINANDLMVILSLTIAALYGAIAWMQLRPGRGASLLQRIIGVNNLVFFGAISTRAYVGIVHGELAVFTPSMSQNMTYIAGYLLLIVNGFGFLLLCKERDDRKMEELATIDSLTGLVNRRAFFERTASARQLAKRLRKPISLMMLDIDHFKRLNDRFGHATGDEALCVFSRTAQSVLRDPDIMGRLGGEEFALVLPGTDLSGALYAAERLRAAVEAAPVFTDGNQFSMTVSIGVASIHPDEHINAALARADHALYAAKTAGRNGVCSGEPNRHLRSA